MTNTSQSVSKTEWGQCRAEFLQHLPKILEQHKAGVSRLQIHTNLSLKSSYRQFCEHLKKALASGSASPPPSAAPDHGSSQPSTVRPVITGKNVSSGGFVMPIISIDEGDE